MSFKGTKAKVVLPREKSSEIKNLTGSQIQLFRKKRGWTQHHLAESLQKIGVPITREVIANIETQRCPVTDCQVVFFARVLGVSWRSLFPDKGVLEAFTPSIASKKQAEDNSDAKTARQWARNPSAEPSSEKWNVCEMTCKSVKITFRGPS